jgi:hypothetical protein
MWCRRLIRHERDQEMNTFTIDSDLNITAHASDEEAANALPPTGAHVFSTAAGLKEILKQFPAATAIDIWNGLTGVTPVKKFQDAATAAKRIFTQLQSLGAAPTPAPVSSVSKTPAKKTARSAAKSQSPEDSRERTSCDEQDRPTDRDASAAQRRNARRGHGAVRVADTHHAGYHERGWVADQKARNHRDQRESWRGAHLPR